MRSLLREIRRKTEDNLTIPTLHSNKYSVVNRSVPCTKNRLSTFDKGSSQGETVQGVAKNNNESHIIVIGLYSIRYHLAKGLLLIPLILVYCIFIYLVHICCTLHSVKLKVLFDPLSSRIRVPLPSLPTLVSSFPVEEKHMKFGVNP